MGFQTTVIIRNDGLGEIKNNAQEFADNLCSAISNLAAYQDVPNYPKGLDISAGCHANPARVVETHHSDSTTLIASGGGTAEQLGIIHKWRWTSEFAKIASFDLMLQYRLKQSTSAGADAEFDGLGIGEMTGAFAMFARMTDDQITRFLESVLPTALKQKLGESWFNIDAKP